MDPSRRRTDWSLVHPKGYAQDRLTGRAGQQIPIGGCLSGQVRQGGCLARKEPLIVSRQRARDAEPAESTEAD